MLTKNYGNVSSNNEVIAKTSSAFLKSSKNFLNQRWPLFVAVFVCGLQKHGLSNGFTANSFTQVPMIFDKLLATDDRNTDV